jgi:sugar lactone lactonase YvrE
MIRRHLWSTLALGIAVSIALALGGCPLASNQNPVADTGAAQTVSPGAAVTLDGSLSSDADGDPLTFAWTQTVGTTVTLSGADTATASFVAPLAAGTLTFQLTVNDGRGGVATATIDVTVRALAQNVLYVANFAANGVLAFDVSSPANINGDVAPSANLTGGQTRLTSPADMVLDGSGTLLVSDFTAKAITGYASALDLPAINGNVVPTRTVQGTATGLVGPLSLAFSAAADLLFAAEASMSTVHVFASASTSVLNGNVAPARNFSSADMDLPRGIHFGANDELYVANGGSDLVSVFAGASNSSGLVSAARMLQSTAFVGLFDVFVDGSDTLYTVNSSTGGNAINIFTGAATLNGTVTPTATLTVTGAVNLTAVVVDSAGNGYVVDFGGNAIYGFDALATRSGELAPDRVLTGASTQLNGPLRLFLHE